MLRCCFCGMCEEACPKESIFLTDRIVPSTFKRREFIYGKDKLVEPVEIDKRINVAVRETKEVGAFKEHNEYAHNKMWGDKKNKH